MIRYKDPMDNYREEFECGPYTGPMAKDVKHNLSLMGCEQFKVVPYVEKKGG